MILGFELVMVFDGLSYGLLRVGESRPSWKINLRSRRQRIRRRNTTRIDESQDFQKWIPR